MENSGFFNGDKEYGQEEFSRYFDNIYESGVSVNSNNDISLKVSNDGSTINVAPGFAVVKGFYLYNPNIITIPITPSEGLNRTDRVVVKLDLSNSSSTVTIEIKKGVATTNTEAEAQGLERTSSVYELSLAKIEINTVGEIKITDERNDKELCGIIRPKGYKAILNDFQTEFNTWVSNMQGKGFRVTHIQAAVPTISSEGDIWIQQV